MTTPAQKTNQHATDAASPAMARAMAQSTAQGHGSEWQTWLLLLAVYGSWLGLVLVLHAVALYA